MLTINDDDDDHDHNHNDHDDDEDDNDNDDDGDISDFTVSVENSWQFISILSLGLSNTKWQQ